MEPARAQQTPDSAEAFDALARLLDYRGDWQGLYQARANFENALFIASLGGVREANRLAGRPHGKNDSV